MLTRAMHPGRATELTDEDIAIARVIGDVWLSALVGWVTGRTTADDVARQMDVAVSAAAALSGRVSPGPARSRHAGSRSARRRRGWR